MRNRAPFELVSALVASITVVLGIGGTWMWLDALPLRCGSLPVGNPFASPNRNDPPPTLTRQSMHHEHHNSPTTKLTATMDDPKVLNIHVVPHTHDDVGWLKTVEQYFYGLNMTIQHACVNDILDSVMFSLLENPSRTFTYVESKFFSMWWKLQDDAMKDSVRFLVANQQLFFANGGWCMHDEAATHFMGMIDQTTLGHRFLKKELGVIPKVGWQLDPFGHSASQASLFTSQLGFDALYFGRIDYQDLKQRHEQQACEGLWNSSTHRDDGTVFWGLTGSYEGNYGSPAGYCFDIGCEDPLLTDMNHSELEYSIHRLLQELQVQSDRTQGNHIMITMGSDFQYQRAHINYANLDLMISSILEMQRLNRIDVPAIFGPRFDTLQIFYSSPEYYTECKYTELQTSKANKEDQPMQPSTMDYPGTNITYKVKTDDFMPYSDCEHCFWTGYFTSRASLKRLERVASSVLMSARQLDSLVVRSTGESQQHKLRKEFSCPSALHTLEDASGVAQHHDGVSGTSKQHVADDYAARLHDGIDQVAACASRKLRRLFLGPNASQYWHDLQYCQLLNETKCDPSQEATIQNGTDVYVIVYNPLAQTRSIIIHLPVSSKASYSVEEVGIVNNSGQQIMVSAIPTLNTGDHGAPYRVVFQAAKVPPMGASVFKVSMHSNVQQPSVSASSDAMWTTYHRQRSLATHKDPDSDVVASNEYYSATFDRKSGKIKEMAVHNVSLTLENMWGYYTSYDKTFDAPPDNHDDNPSSKNNQNSGAYIFRPSSPDQKPTFIQQIDAVFYNTSVGLEVHAKFEVPWIKTITRVTTGQPFLEVEYTIGPIPTDDGRGKEIISRFQTPIQNSGILYTDSNGREFMKRQRNFRPTWDLNVFEPVAGNYYPVNAAIYIQDDSGVAISVATDRSQGGASLDDGCLELMVQRRTLADDWRGVDEPMNETDGGITAYPPYGNATRLGDGVVIKGKHYIRIGNQGGAALARSMMDPAFADAMVFVGTARWDEKPAFVATRIVGSTESVPPNVMVITRSMLYDEETPTILLRLGHQYGIGEDANLSRPVEVDLTSFLPGYKIVSVSETTLSANQDLQAWKKRRFDWIGGHNAREVPQLEQAAGTTVTLEPMEIRTFTIKVVDVSIGSSMN